MEDCSDHARAWVAPASGSPPLPQSNVPASANPLQASREYHYARRVWDRPADGGCYALCRDVELPGGEESGVDAGAQPRSECVCGAPECQQGKGGSRRALQRVLCGVCPFQQPSAPFGHPLTTPPAAEGAVKGAVRVREYVSCIAIKAHEVGTELLTCYFEDSQVRPSIVKMVVPKSLWSLVQKYESALRWVRRGTVRWFRARTGG